MLKSIFKVGLPIGLQSSLYPIANMMIQANINSMGTDNIAAWALCGKLDFLVWLLVDSLAAAISTFVAQNFGASQYARIRQGVRTGLGMTLAFIISISAVLSLWSEQLGKLFINAADYDVLPLTGQLMRFLAPMYFLYVFGEVLASAIRGTGETVKPMILTLLGTCLSRILWILFVVPRNRTMFTIIWSYPVSWLITAIGFIVFYSVFKKKKLSLPLICENSLMTLEYTPEGEKR
jgi:Na+-driven multidrug efflux pump